jgi:DNA-binding NarL/FixJ family response regulator
VPMPQPPRAVRVLVVDRDPRVRTALRQLLAAHPPDTVLVDPLLPTAADGIPVLSAAVSSGIRIVVLTADRPLRASARRLGITGVLDKDGDHDELLAALRGHGDSGG